MSNPFSGINLPQPGQSLQRKQRVWRIFTDQHGRKFGAQADIATNSPIGEFQPQSRDGYSIAPWYPTMRYAKFAQTSDLDFRWDYMALAEDWSAMAQAYYEDALKLSVDLNIPEKDLPEVGGVVDRRVRAVLGHPPMSPAIPLACELGDPWMLGKLGVAPNLELKAILTQQSGANGQEALRVIRARLEERATEAGIEPVIAAPPKAIAEEKVKSITDVDETAPISDTTWSQFNAAARKRGVIPVAEIPVAWAEFKRDRDAQKAVA